MIIKITKSKNSELIGTIWDLDEKYTKAKCVFSNNSKYQKGFEIKIEDLGEYESEKYELLLENF